LRSATDFLFLLAALFTAALEGFPGVRVVLAAPFPANLGADLLNVRQIPVDFFDTMRDLRLGALPLPDGSGAREPLLSPHPVAEQGAFLPDRLGRFE
jgi:hypothetical protein